MVQTANHTSRILRVALTFAPVQLGLHVSQLVKVRDPHLAGPHIVAWLHDLVLLAIVVLVTWFIVRQVRQHAFRQCLSAVSIITLFTAGMLLSIYPRLLTQFPCFSDQCLSCRRRRCACFFGDRLPRLAIAVTGKRVLRMRRLGGSRILATDVDANAIDRRTDDSSSWPSSHSPAPHRSRSSSEYSRSARHWLSGQKRIVPSLVLPSRATAIPLSLEPSPLASARSIHYDHVFICVFEKASPRRTSKRNSSSPATASGTACRTIR